MKNLNTTTKIMQKNFSENIEKHGDGFKCKSCDRYFGTKIGCILHSEQDSCFPSKKRIKKNNQICPVKECTLVFESVGALTTHKKRKTSKLFHLSKM